MQLSTAYRASDEPFEGDRLVAFRGLPVDAVVKRATLTVTPTAVAEQPPRVPFEEVFAFGPPRASELAAAEWGVTAATTDSSVEVDLHARRTLVSVGGSNINQTLLAVDVGGLFVELNDRGAVKTPGDTAFPMGPTGALPGVTVPRFRLTGTATAVPSVDTVAVRSVPTNVSVKLGNLGPFWTYVGELAAPQTTPDFAETLQAFLLQATIENGTYVVPFGLHSDGIARLDLVLELEFLRARSVLPDGLPEVTLPFDLSTFAGSAGGSLSVRLPAGARVVPGATTARVRGAFDATRIAAGAGTGDNENASAEAVVSGERGAAQPVEPAADIVVTGFDLFLAALSPTVRLNVELLGDSDGKPFGEPLLPAPLELRMSREESRAAKWTTVPLAEPFSVEANRRYWLVLQALEGEASWQASAAAAGAVPLQISSDAGLSWSAATDAHVPGPLAAQFRVRVTPVDFTMPVSIDVGGGAATQHVSLRRFEPLGRVDMTIDTPELAAAFESAATAAAPGACSTAEHLANGEFDQWIGIGDDLARGDSISLQGSPRSLALSSDGDRAYVGTVAAGTSETTPSRTLLEPVELACGEAADPIVLDSGRLPVDPVLVAVNAGAERAYVVADLDGEAWLFVVDLAGAALIGEPVPLDPFTGLALAPDGERLFLLRDDGGGTAVIAALDARTAERLAREGTGSASAAVTPVATVALQTGESVAGDLPTPFAAAAAAGETLLAFAVDGHTAAARLCLIAVERPDAPAFAPIGRAPRALAATPDGSRVVVACTGDNSLSVVSGDTASQPTSVSLAAVPVAVTVSSDGGRAAVLSATDIAVYDLSARRSVATESTGASPSAIAGSSRLDVVFVAESEGGGLARFATPSVPLEWTLLSGVVQPWCFAGDVAALLGRFRVARGIRKDPVRPEASAISQVVPVSGGCRYELSFRAIADQPDSLAEILWRPGDCGLARTDKVPITEFERSTPSVRRQAPASLVLHRAVLEAPAGAEQAEVRFTTPAGGLAAVGFVSLRGTDAAALNSDLRQRQNGQAVGWNSDPQGADVTLGPAADVVRLANEGADSGALVQEITVAAGRDLELELLGRTTATGADPGPRLEVRFLDASDAAVGDAATAPLSRESFDRVALAVAPPAGAVKAEIRLELPPGAVVELESIDVRQEADADVPVAFRSESPGELTVAGAQVEFDRPGVPAPSVPQTGLCPPTRPGEEPGGEVKPACGCCGSKDTGDEAGSVVTPSGRPAVLRRCANCGCTTISVSGAPSPRAPVLAPSRPLGNAFGVGLPAERTPATHTLLDVVGIGPVRARKLARVGIATVDRLAAANPEVVAAIVGGITRSGAASMIGNAGVLAADAAAAGSSG